MTEREMDILENPEIPPVDASDGTPDASLDSSESGSGSEFVESVPVAVPEDRPFMTTSFQDYTVTEGLLLLLFVLVLAQFFLNLVRRWF